MTTFDPPKKTAVLQTGVLQTNQSNWPSWSRQDRCRVVAKTRRMVASIASTFIEACHSDQRDDPLETVTAELFPLCATLKYIGRKGPRILRPRHCGFWGRPVWLFGVYSTVHRVPLGEVLILGTWNYPIFLVGAQIAQALAAGNRVIVKPAAGCEELTRILIECFHQAGVPVDAIKQIDSTAQSAIDAIDARVDLIVLTGAAETGRQVLTQAAKTLTPAVMELSGCDAAIVLPDADLERAAAAIAFGLQLNSGSTCIAPRRLILPDSMEAKSDSDQLVKQIIQRLQGADHEQPKTRDFIIHPAARNSVADAIENAILAGAENRLGPFDAQRLRQTGRMQPVVLQNVSPDSDITSTDLFAPVLCVIRVNDIEAAIETVNRCRYRLAASVFGSRSAAEAIAAKLQVGSVVINDVITPTADPRVPFGGRADSGFGVTRGDEGLLAMTAAKVISRRVGRFAPHLMNRRTTDLARLTAALKLIHGDSLSHRLAAAWQMIFPIGKQSAAALLVRRPDSLRTRSANEHLVVANGQRPANAKRE